MLHTKVDYLLELSETTPLGLEDEKFFKLAKRINPEGEKISSAVMSMLLKSGSPTAGSSSVKTLNSSFADLPPISVSLGEEEYQKRCSYERSRDLKQAFLSYKKAADQGNANAQYNLGVCYQNGQGVAQDYKEAVRWFQQAADQGHALAQNNLGNYCKNA